MYICASYISYPPINPLGYSSVLSRPFLLTKILPFFFFHNLYNSFLILVDLMLGNIGNIARREPMSPDLPVPAPVPYLSGL